MATVSTFKPVMVAKHQFHHRGRRAATVLPRVAVSL